MNAATALTKQIERYRKMTGEERLAIALELHELACDIAREVFAASTPMPMPRKSSDCSVNASN